MLVAGGLFFFLASVKTQIAVFIKNNNQPKCVGGNNQCIYLAIFEQQSTIRYFKEIKNHKGKCF